MIVWLLAMMGVLIVTLGLHVWWIDRRARRDREKFRHITGARPWWGRR